MNVLVGYVVDGLVQEAAYLQGRIYDQLSVGTGRQHGAHHVLQLEDYLEVVPLQVLAQQDCLARLKNFVRTPLKVLVG